MSVLSRASLTRDYGYFLRVSDAVAARLPEHWREELRSEALVAMVEASDAWDPEKGTSHRAFVSERIDQRMHDELRKLTHYDRVTGTSRNAGGSLDEAVGTDGGDFTTGKDRLVSQASSPHERAVVSERFSALAAVPERLRLALVLDVPVAARRLGVSVDRVTQLRRDARKALLGVAPKHPWPDADLVVVAVTTSPLTPQELSVLHLIALGESNAEVGVEMLISEETVKSHVGHLMHKLRARNRTHAVNIAWEAAWWEAKRNAPPRGAPRRPRRRHDRRS